MSISYNNPYKKIAGLLLLLAIAVIGGKCLSLPGSGTLMAQSESRDSTRRILGSVATVSEAETNMQFVARVDTGARTCSLHTSEKQILDGAEYMEHNVGKTVRFRVENRQGESQWLERPIAEVRLITTSEGEETRYLVPMTFTVDKVEREVLVSLNDRSRMSYSMLLGRNFLAGYFVVDVTGADDGPALLARGQ